MSAASIASSPFLNYNSQTTQNNTQQVRQEFQQLGTDIQSRNISAAQQDLVSLQQLTPQASTTASTQSANPVALDFSQLSQDLQSGNIPAAQQDYSKIQQDTQSQKATGHHHHHHGGGGGGSNEISQLFDQLGESLQSGNLSSAQQVYATLQQDTLQLGQSGASSTESSAPSPSGVSVSA